MFYCRLELCLQQNEIMDIFTDDYVDLADDDGIADQSTTDTHLKVSGARETSENKEGAVCHFQFAYVPPHTAPFCRNISHSQTYSLAKTSWYPGLSGILQLRVNDWILSVQCVVIIVPVTASMCNPSYVM